MDAVDPRPVLTLCVASHAGDMAVREASALARGWAVPLVVVAVAPIERRHHRCCGGISISVQRWNELMRESASLDLERARAAVVGGAAAGFVVAAGSSVSDVIGEIAES